MYYVTRTDVEIHHDSGLKSRGYPGTGSAGGHGMNVKTVKTRASQGWSEKQDQILLDIVHSYRGNTIPWKSLKEKISEFIPNKSLNMAKHRLIVLNNSKKAPK